MRLMCLKNYLPLCIGKSTQILYRLELHLIFNVSLAVVLRRTDLLERLRSSLFENTKKNDVLDSLCKEQKNY